jgi:hypothetical protein
VERELELASFTETDDSLACVLGHPDGSEEKFGTDWLIGCDGAHSTIRKSLGLQFRGDSIPYNFALADVHAAGLQVPPDELAIFLHSDGMVLFIPIKGDRYRIIADLGPSTGGPRVDPSLKEIQEIIDRRVAGSVSLFGRSGWRRLASTSGRWIPTGWAGCSSPAMLPIFTVLPEDRHEHGMQVPSIWLETGLGVRREANPDLLDSIPRIAAPWRSTCWPIPEAYVDCHDEESDPSTAPQSVRSPRPWFSAARHAIAERLETFSVTRAVR